jgi:hypothetical protein
VVWASWFALPAQAGVGEEAPLVCASSLWPNSVGERRFAVAERFALADRWCPGPSSHAGPVTPAATITKTAAITVGRPSATAKPM